MGNGRLLIHWIQERRRESSPISSPFCSPKSKVAQGGWRRTPCDGKPSSTIVKLVMRLNPCAWSQKGPLLARLLGTRGEKRMCNRSRRNQHRKAAFVHLRHEACWQPLYVPLSPSVEKSDTANGIRHPSIILDSLSTDADGLIAQLSIGNSDVGALAFLEIIGHRPSPMDTYLSAKVAHTSS